MSNGIMFDIQRFAVHDGPGIRTTVFLKGCSCRCAWCHNPESLSVRPELEFYPARCIGCGRCFEACLNGAHSMDGENHQIDRAKCTGCGLCADTCYADALVISGREATLSDVMETVLADKPYYDQSGGGVTLSGGEPALQTEFARAILAACKAEGIHTAIQTAGNYPFAMLDSLIPHLDLVMYDIKGFAESIYTWHIRGDRERIFGNLAALDKAFDGQIAVRTPVVGSVNDTPGEIESIAIMIKDLHNLAYYQLMPYHALGRAKYDALGAGFAAGYYTPSPEQIAELEAVALRHVPVFNINKGIVFPQ